MSHYMWQVHGSSRAYIDALYIAAFVLQHENGVVWFLVHFWANTNSDQNKWQKKELFFL